MHIVSNYYGGAVTVHLPNSGGELNIGTKEEIYGGPGHGRFMAKTPTGYVLSGGPGWDGEGYQTSVDAGSALHYYWVASECARGNALADDLPEATYHYGGMTVTWTRDGDRFSLVRTNRFRVTYAYVDEPDSEPEEMGTAKLCAELTEYVAVLVVPGLTGIKEDMRIEAVGPDGVARPLAWDFEEVEYDDSEDAHEWLCSVSDAASGELVFSFVAHLADIWPNASSPQF